MQIDSRSFNNFCLDLTAELNVTKKSLMQKQNEIETQLKLLKEPSSYLEVSSNEINNILMSSQLLSDNVEEYSSKVDELEKEINSLITIFFKDYEIKIKKFKLANIEISKKTLEYNSKRQEFMLLAKNEINSTLEKLNDSVQNLSSFLLENLDMLSILNIHFDNDQKNLTISD